ncbi:uncharacterized protein A1O5_12649 [Cladophialophora psammophila CBS 110553]|uniref:Major facilitator superfamily (MFS) profile domain-containing protein n=1 Tax=Cladophialophora psammophila CBS 110553 TaxID=1182543 RepID=W9VL44_9EURO|nr:uncharacterized protein A1O5_12649 [Cladophialophora psammophila CBS 110553]EXJ56382.1 hypothetical protein A1O5_12649 [Cladophialophora psammophila CBS 110553]
MATTTTTTAEALPPGTQRIEDLAGAHIVLAPQPNADPNQPLNWSPWRKSLHMVLLCLYGLMVFAILCASQPLWQIFYGELGISYATLNNGYAANTATLAVGCVFLVPIALRYGRRPMYLLTALFLLGIAIWQAVFYTGEEYLAYSTLCGIAGALNEALFQVTISDLFFVHQRGTMNGCFLISVNAGVYLSPVAAGYIAASHNWRWIFWICTIITSVLIVAMVLFFEETKYTPPTMLGHNPEETSNETVITKISSISKDPVNLGNSQVQQTKGDGEGEQYDYSPNQPKRPVPIDTSIPMNSYLTRLSLWTSDKIPSTQDRGLWKHAYYPFAILLQFPAVALAAIVYGFDMAMLSIVTIVQTTLYPYPPYNMGTIGVGNLNMAPMAGVLLGSLYGGPFVDWAIVQIAKRRQGIYEPETRLWMFIFPSLVQTAGIFMYGLTLAKGMPWPINAVGAGFVGFGLGGAGDIVLTYCQDCYQYILGDALTSVVFVRNIITTILVFSIAPWMEGMGIYNMFVLLGCLSAVISFSCVPFLFWGRAWRVRLAAKYKYYASKQY